MLFIKWSLHYFSVVCYSDGVWSLYIRPCAPSTHTVYTRIGNVLWTGGHLGLIMIHQEGFCWVIIVLWWLSVNFKVKSRFW